MIVDLSFSVSFFLNNRHYEINFYYADEEVPAGSTGLTGLYLEGAAWDQQVQSVQHSMSERTIIIKHSVLDRNQLAFVHIYVYRLQSYYILC